MATRNNPIPETLRKIPNFPLCVTYFQIPASCCWYVRVWLNNKYYIKSTGQQDEAEAVKEAKKYFYSLQMQKDRIEPVTTLQPRQSHQFEKVCQSLAAEDTIKANNKNRAKNRPEDEEPRLVREQRLILEKDVIPFFRTMALKDITFKKINDYMKTLSDRRLSGSTRNKHLIAIRKVLKHASEQEMLDKLPLFPHIDAAEIADQGEFFEEDEFETLKNGISKAIKEKVVVGGHPITPELRMLCSFMVSSFLRVTDIYTLKHSQIQVKREKDRDGKRNIYLSIKLYSKVRKLAIVTLSSAVDIYEDLLKMHEGMTGPDDFVWFPAIKNRATFGHVMNDQLNHVLEAINLKTGLDGNTRTLGSLRSSAIIFALRNGSMDTHTLAVNARTSEKVITSNYGRYLLPELSVAKIQSKRK
jgi:site-specific recombinase XerD